MRFMAMVVALLLPLAAQAHDFDKDGIHIIDPWVRAPIGLSRTTAGYFGIQSFDLKGDRLIGARSDAAARIELHTHDMVDGVMRMRHVEALPVRPMGSADLVPGGHHLMIMGLKTPLKPGDNVTVTLIFETVGELEIVLPVRKPE